MEKNRKNMRCILFLAILAISAARPFVNTVSAEELIREFAHTGMRGACCEFEHLIKLPDEYFEKGLYFVSRQIDTVGKIAILEEQLSPFGYYLKLQLPPEDGPSTGTLKVRLEVASTPGERSEPVRPASLKVKSGRSPEFSWAGSASLTALTVTDLKRKEVIWKQIIPGNRYMAGEDGIFKSGRRYLLSACGISETGICSMPAYCSFELDYDRTSRSLICGKITGITLAPPDSPPDLQGIMGVEDVSGNTTLFLVSIYTLILVGDNGHAFAATLNQLKPGWKCEVAYDLEDEDETGDKRHEVFNSCISSKMKYADSIYVHYPRQIP